MSLLLLSSCYLNSFSLSQISMSVPVSLPIIVPRYVLIVLVVIGAAVGMDTGWAKMIKPVV